METQKDRVRFMYFRNEKRQPVACLAYRLTDLKENSGTMIWGISVHNPVDVFRKTEARMLASERLEKNGIQFEFSHPFGRPFLADILRDFCYYFLTERLEMPVYFTKKQWPRRLLNVVNRKFLESYSGLITNE